VSFTDIDQGSKMTTFESILTTFRASIDFRGCLGSSKNWLEFKINPPLAKRSLPKSMKHTVAKEHVKYQQLRFSST
jgi:hypothetical protein